MKVEPERSEGKFFKILLYFWELVHRHSSCCATPLPSSRRAGALRVSAGADPGGGTQGAHVPPIFGLAVPNLSPTLHARTPMTPPARPPVFKS